MNISPRFSAPFLYILYRLWCWTLRITQSGRERVNGLEAAGKIMMFPIWHDELFPLTCVRGSLRLVTIISQSRDGEYVARLQEAMGVQTVRGSSSKGGLKALLKVAALMRRQRYNCSLTVDGPRGPRHAAKPGAVILAFRTSAYIVPVRAFMKNRKCFSSWDHFQLPWPFTRVHVAWGEPYKVEVPDLSEISLRRERIKLESRLNSMSTPDGFR